MIKNAAVYTGRRLSVLAVLLVIAVVLTMAVVLPMAVTSVAFAASKSDQAARVGEWPVYGADKAGTKYSPLDQITAENFEDLEIVWRWKSVDEFVSKTTDDGGEWWSATDVVVERLQQETPGLYRERNTPRYSRLQATPLMIGDVLYLNTPLSQGVAVDARSGKTKWVYNPKSYEEGTTSMTVTWRQRGVAYWSDGPERSDERILWGTGSGDLVCVDAKNGYPCAGFGNKGRIDLTQDLPRAERTSRDYLNAMLYSVQSPPIIVGDVVIHGSSIADRRINKEAVPGWVRAWDVRTGEHRWDFHTVPQEGEEGVETWGNDSWRYSGNANVWTYLSADEELGYVYLPTGTPTNDYYGGHRPGDNLFAESIVAVDVESGEKVWHFQAVHHGLWDYDFPTAPNLLDVTVDGKPIKALAQVSKQGFLYAFDRVTGDPIWPIEERSVPTDSNIPGEVPAPTQPFPTKPAPFEYQGVVEDDLVDFTPQIRQMAIDAVKGFRLGPLYTPQMMADATTKGLLFRPTGAGGANWSGAAVDPETGILYVPSNNSAGVIPFYEPDGGSLDYTHGAPEAIRLDQPNRVGAPTMPSGLPLLKPPYSRMTAIDMNTGEHLWMTPLGNGDLIRRHRMLRHLDLPPLGGDGRGGPLLTKTLLMTALSAGGSDGGARLVAYDKANGDELGSVDLPRGAIGTPMTYMLDGKQYIALTVGGSPPELIALALPEVSRQALATSSILPFEASRKEASRTREASRTQASRTGDSPALAPRSVWSGVYSQAQAARGEQAFVRNCIACHSDKLGEMAGHGPAHAVIGPDFRVRWTGASIADLYDTIMQTMPAGASNSLSPGEYADLTAFLLRINEYPAGTAEINPYQRDHLMRITIDELAPSLHTPLNSN